MREFWNGLATVRKVSPQLRTARHSGDSAKWFLFQAEPPSVLTLTVRHKGRDTLTTLSAWKKKKKSCVQVDANSSRRHRAPSSERTVRQRVRPDKLLPLH